ncbi:unnamed protein product [Phytophthora fragariaefolia]|uniref:Unnamed protein product n=1 Tax=Phytophthora fragariaefolia TaxID=1490495 RepID=A0A9W6TZ61_9STRA|nr:unnamed protein product [Phytophthora fragariaefolia]
MKLDHTKYSSGSSSQWPLRILGTPDGSQQSTNNNASAFIIAVQGFNTHTIVLRRYLRVYEMKDIDEHLRALRDVVEILKNNQLYVKLSKCVFSAEEIPYLGDLIGRNGVRIDPHKLQTIRDWPVPRTPQQLHSFIGLTGYVKRFCEQYAELTVPLFTLLKKKNET